MKYFCNPVNVNYRYQFNADQRRNGIEVAREAADPSMICFKGKYYIFASMTLGVWVSEDLVSWSNHKLPDNLPLYDYAPDVRVVGQYVYFCASKRGEVCNYYRTKDILEGPYEEIPGTFDFWDPHLFADEDGRMFFYWGCSNITPIWGVELNPETMQPMGEKQELISGHPFSIGYERMGVDNCEFPKSQEEIEICYQQFLKSQGNAEENLPKEYIPLIKGMFSRKPFIEGAWMNKYKGKYYLQYACPGTEYNSYGDGVYISNSPLGPFELAENNPYSYKPGGFAPGAGHGSTEWDYHGNLWHTGTIRISVNHQFERRVGIWPAGFDAEGELFCNQRYGDWPQAVEEGKINPWEDPKWYLLSYGKAVTASSSEAGHEPALAVNEDIKTWWRAETAQKGQWLQVDLGETFDVNAIQVNFADDKIDIPAPGTIRGTTQARYIEEAELVTRWILEGSIDGENYFMVEDKSEVNTELSHDFLVREDGIQVRYLKLTILEVPYDQKPCISGLRVFGKGHGEKPLATKFKAQRTNDLDMQVEIEPNSAMGYNILWGHRPDKMYHSYMVFGESQRIGALVKDRQYYVRVDAFNENGITEGTTVLLEEK